MYRFFSALLTIMVGLTTFAPLVIAQTPAPLNEEEKKRLEAELQRVEREMLTTAVLVEDKQLERQSLERDVSLIEGQIKKAQLGIQARSLSIVQINDQIGQKQEVISLLENKLENQRESLADLVRRSAIIDDYSLVEVMLSRQSFSDFFQDIASFNAIKESLNESVAALHHIRRDTYEQKSELEGKQETEAEMKQIQELQKKEIEQKEKEKEQILKVTKGEEREYKQLLESQQRTAAQLRNALFTLLGGGGGIPFPEAVSLAKYASNVTGVDAALILAILEQETNLGSNLGSCIYNDIRGGRPAMHPDRDAPVFLAIADILGFDVRTRSVSCPISRGGTFIGWGGAMGPSQFIPSTWATYGGIVNNGSGWVYSESADAIRRINGNNSPANPFNNRDAFIATALLLRDNGAGGTYASDRLAALRYYAGWGGANNPANAFYGDGVMQRKARLAQEISTLGE